MNAIALCAVTPLKHALIACLKRCVHCMLIEVSVH